ncbi:MAG: hypothetical protein EA360_09545 [Balneolaceae bacterium]|nr:MAG: hypothetical protein EA360_09545 [Balneolaceae bacterium]
MDELDYKEALHILPAVVDNEATEQEKVKFFSFIEKNPLVRKEYEHAIRIKRIVASRLPRYDAPPHLHENVLQCIRNLDLDRKIGAEEESSGSASLLSLRVTDHFRKEKSLYYRFIFAAAVILVMTFSIVQFLDQSTYYGSDAGPLIVEFIAAEHFIGNSGTFIEPHFATDQRSEAEEYLRSHFGMDITIPAVSGADFSGIVMAEFTPGFQTPLLGYSQDEIGEIIYLFAFDMDHMSLHEQLVRHEIAAETCLKHSDFYVAEIFDHHVVSWLWDNTWYAAVSNHNGYDLAALVEPLWE